MITSSISYIQDLRETNSSSLRSSSADVFVSDRKESIEDISLDSKTKGSIVSNNKLGSFE